MYQFCARDCAAFELVLYRYVSVLKGMHGQFMCFPFLIIHV
jgi:hypothetical protein